MESLTENDNWILGYHGFVRKSNKKLYRKDVPNQTWERYKSALIGINNYADITKSKTKAVCLVEVGSVIICI